MRTQPSVKHHSQENSDSNLANLNFFEIIKLDHIPEEEKQERLLEMSQLVMMNFINADLPLLLVEDDFQILDKMIKQEEKMNMVAIQEFLRLRIEDFDLIILQKTLELKKQLIISHYETELTLREREQKEKGLERIEQILAIHRMVQAAKLEDWNTVLATIPHTLVKS